MNLHDNPQLFGQAISIAADFLNIKRQFVEKDYWICRSLRLMAASDPEHRTIFKGGTSLTKAYGIGSRFSEDIDVAVANALSLSGNQLKNLIRNTAHNMSAGLQEVPKPGVTSKGSHYHKAFYAYPLSSDIPTGGAIRTGELLLEINSFANPHPWSICKIESFIYTFLARTGKDSLAEQYNLLPFYVPVLDKRTTLTEKLVSLLRYSLAENHTDTIQSKIRHFYDLYYLMQDDDCRHYVESKEFVLDLTTLFVQDQKRFEQPKGWQSMSINDSPLLTDWHSVWENIENKYLSELPELAYKDIPPSQAIEEAMAELISYLQKERKDF